MSKFLNRFLRKPDPAARAVMAAAVKDLVHCFQSDEHPGDPARAFNQHSVRKYQPIDLYKATFQMTPKQLLDRSQGLVPDAWHDDLTFQEAVGLASELVLSDDMEKIIQFFDANLVGADFSSLIYWPNEWFEDEDMLHVELTHEEMVSYAMEVSGRTLLGAVKTTLPYPIPDARKRQGGAIQL